MFVNKEKLDAIRMLYWPGTRVSLVDMDDDQAPPPGTRGTVMAVDDAGTIHVKWDNGSTLGAIYGVDRVQIISQGN